MDRDLTLRLAKFNHDVDQLSVPNDAGMADIFAYLSLALCVLNLVGLGYLLYRFRRFPVVLNYNQQVPLTVPLSTHADTSTLD